MARLLRAQPLARQTFTPYGDVIECDDHDDIKSINRGYTQRYHDLATLELDRQQGRPSINIFRSQPLEEPITLCMMERHPLSSQAFFPLSTRPYLVAVAPRGVLDPMNIEVFVAQGNQGVNYAPGVWHHFCLALEERSNFLVIDRIGPGDNCDEVRLNADEQIVLAAVA